MNELPADYIEAHAKLMRIGMQQLQVSIDTVCKAYGAGNLNLAVVAISDVLNGAEAMRIHITNRLLPEYYGPASDNAEAEVIIQHIAADCAQAQVEFAEIIAAEIDFEGMIEVLTTEVERMLAAE